MDMIYVFCVLKRKVKGQTPSKFFQPIRLEMKERVLIKFMAFL